jgi:hypothetical protein
MPDELDPHDDLRGWRRDPVTYLLEKVSELDRKAVHFVTDKEFAPVRLIVYGMVGIILMAILGAVISKVIIK